jgi:magnesium-transporting ATPase (P-type)
LKDFFTMLAVCHTCMVEKEKKSKDPAVSNDDGLKYSASSPDELALVMGAKDVGIVFHKRTSSTISIMLEHNQTEEDYDALVEFPFDSTRKRMSLLVRHLQTNRYFLLCKGADTIMLPRIKIDIQTQQRVE